MKIKLASFGRRILAFATDLVLTLMLLLCFHTLVCMPVAVLNTDYEASINEYAQIRLQCHLFESVDDKIVLISDKYDEHLTLFYDDYIKDISKYNEAKVESGLFEENNGVYTPLASVSEEKLNEFYLTQLNNAEILLYSDDKVIEMTSLITSVTVWTLLIALVFSVTVFYLLIPMILKNGATLGKMIFGFGLSNKKGYRVTRLQILIRYLVFLIFEVILSIFLLGIPLLVSFSMMTFSKYGTALHDYLAYTVVVEVKGVTMYKNEEELERDYHRIKGSKDFTIHSKSNF